MPQAQLATSPTPAAALLRLLILCCLRLRGGYQPFYGLHPDYGVLKVNGDDLVGIRDQRFRSAFRPDNEHVIHAGLDDVLNRSYGLVVSLRDNREANELEAIVGTVRQRDDVLFPDIECCATGDRFRLCARANLIELDDKSIHAAGTGACNGYRLLREEEPATRFKPLRKVRQDFYLKFTLDAKRTADATYCYIG